MHALLSNVILYIHTGICHLDRSPERYGPFSVPLTQQKTYIHTVTTHCTLYEVRSHCYTHAVHCTTPCYQPLSHSINNSHSYKKQQQQQQLQPQQQQHPQPQQQQQHSRCRHDVNAVLRLHYSVLQYSDFKR